MELSDYWRALRRRWRVLLACTLLGVLLAALATALMPRTYEARAELFVAPEAGTTTADLMQGSSFLLDRVKSYVEIVDKDIVLAPVIEELGLPLTVPVLAERVEASVVTETVVVQIAATDASPSRAARIANATAAEFAARAPALEPTRSDDTAVVQVTVVDPATVPSEPVSPRPALNLALGLMAGLALGVGAAVAREALDRRVKGEADVKALTLAPVIGHVPLDDAAASDPLVVGPAARSIRAEALRQVRTNLQFLDVPSGERSYVVTSSQSGEGKTVSAINLALTLAEVGQRVCLLEADLRRPTAGRYTGLEGSVGLTDVLIGSVGWEDVVQPWGSGLHVVLAGSIPPNPSDLLASAAMERLLDTLTARYDVVILDAPPLLPVTDAALLARRCAGAIVVVAADRKAVTRHELSHALDKLVTVDARILGVLLNKLPQRGPDAPPISSYAYDSFAEPSGPGGRSPATGDEDPTREDREPRRSEAIGNTAQQLKS